MLRRHHAFGADARLDIFNDAAHSIYLNIDPGNSGSVMESAVLFSNNGTRRWFVGNNAANILYLMFNDGGTARPAIGIDDDGAQVKIGFFGTAPAARPSVPDGSSLATVINALQALGLVSA